MNNLIKETLILDYNSLVIQDLINSRQWKELNDVEKVKSIYNFVRDEIKFGYNSSDDIRASQVLKDGYGQCNTKSTLLMALLRAVNIPNRLHGFTINLKDTETRYKKSFLHSQKRFFICPTTNSQN